MWISFYNKHCTHFFMKGEQYCSPSISSLDTLPPCEWHQVLGKAPPVPPRLTAGPHTVGQSDSQRLEANAREAKRAQLGSERLSGGEGVGGGGGD